MFVEITIPVLNEENSLRQNIEKALSFIKEIYSDLGKFTLIIADNGSADATAEIGLQLEQDYSGVKYFRVKERGVGLALKTSWGASKADIVGYMDLDLATDLKHLPEALAALQEEGYDIVTGSRLLPRSEVVNRKLLRSVVSRVFNFIVHSYFSTRFSDGMCGFKFLRPAIYKDLYNCGAKSNGWFFATEILIAAEHLDYKLKDIPVRWVDAPDSKANITKLAVEYTKAMRRLKKALSRA